MRRLPLSLFLAVVLLLLAIPARADYSVVKGTFAANTSTGDQTVDTGSGIVMKAVLLWGTTQTSEGFTTEASGFFGMATSSSARSAVAWSSDDNVTPTVTGGGYFTDRAVEIFSDGAPTEDAIADFVSFGTGGNAGKFTINWSDAPGSAWIIHYMALGGSDITGATIKSLTAHANDGTDATTGIGFQPDMLLFLGSTRTSTGSGANASLIMGSTTGTGNMAALWAGSVDNTALQDHPAALQNPDACLEFPTTEAGQSVQSTAVLTSFDSDGYTLTWDVLGVNPAYLYSALAIKGGSYNLGTFIGRSTAGTQAVTGVGFQPAGLFFFVNPNNMTFDGNNVELMNIALGGTDGTTQGVAWTNDDQMAASGMPSRTNMMTKTDKLIGSYRDVDASGCTGNICSESSLTSLDSDGYTLNWNKGAGTRRYFALSFAAAMSGGSSLGPLQTQGPLQTPGPLQVPF